MQDCLTLLHVMAPPPKVKTHPDVDFKPKTQQIGTKATKNDKHTAIYYIHTHDSKGDGELRLRIFSMDSS